MLASGGGSSRVSLNQLIPPSGVARLATTDELVIIA